MKCGWFGCPAIVHDGMFCDRHRGNRIFLNDPRNARTAQTQHMSDEVLAIIIGVCILGGIAALAFWVWP